jgi:hypothetical protein
VIFRAVSAPRFNVTFNDDVHRNTSNTDTKASSKGKHAKRSGWKNFEIQAHNTCWKNQEGKKVRRNFKEYLTLLPL